jgi:hypothetical protein
MRPRLTFPSEDPHRAGNVGAGDEAVMGAWLPMAAGHPPSHPVRCICGRWVANSQEPETDTTMVTCAKCRRHAQVREFFLRQLERIRHRG